MKKYSNELLRAILSGIYVTVAATTFLIVYNLTHNKLIAALLFSFALLLIVNKGYYLYTGKIGYLLPYYKGASSIISVTIIGNIIGIIGTGLLIRISNMGDIVKLASEMVDIKFSSTWYQSLILSIFCGILMYTAVDGFGRIKNDLSKNLIVIFSVIIFLVLGFDHSIANFAYLILAGRFSITILGYLIIMLIGNAIGAILMNLLHIKLNKEN